MDCEFLWDTKQAFLVIEFYQGPNTFITQECVRYVQVILISLAFPGESIVIANISGNFYLILNSVPGCRKFNYTPDRTIDEISFRLVLRPNTQLRLDLFF